VWQRIHEELGPQGLDVVTVALDATPEEARPWIDAARPSHPSLVDPWHVVPDLYNVVNVPTAVWIDERGRLARPADVAFGTDTFRHITGIAAERHLAALRDWVSGGTRPLADDRLRALVAVPSRSDQQARTEFAIGRWLWERGRQEAASRHFDRAGALAPHDFTIRRGTMPMLGQDPMGPAFRRMLAAWKDSGRSYYEPLET
jgi:hypothetical protein